jgi:hypothetical protein
MELNDWLEMEVVKFQPYTVNVTTTTTEDN